MKFYTEEEIEKKVKEIWTCPEDDDWNEPEKINVSIGKDNIKIEVSSMYESPPLNLPILMQLADFFETKNINDDDRFGYGGCETCDYGSSYGFTLTVRPEPYKGEY